MGGLLASAGHRGRISVPLRAFPCALPSALPLPHLHHLLHLLRLLRRHPRLRAPPLLLHPRQLLPRGPQRLPERVAAGTRAAPGRGEGGRRAPLRHSGGGRALPGGDLLGPIGPVERVGGFGEGGVGGGNVGDHGREAVAAERVLEELGELGIAEGDVLPALRREGRGREGLGWGYEWRRQVVDVRRRQELMERSGGRQYGRERCGMCAPSRRRGR